MRWIGLGAALALVAVGAVVTNGRAATAVAPAATAEPQIVGPAVVGSPLSATTGTWSNNPTSFTYQWLRCPVSGGASDGSDCTAITGATTNAYTPSAAADVGFRLRVKVTATNADGSASATSNAAETIPATTGVANTALPTVTGSPVVGQTLTGTNGTFTGDNLTYTYAWWRCLADGTCAPISGATAATYAVVQADVGATLRLTVVATSGTSKLAASAAPTAVVTAGSTPPPTPPPATGCPTGTGVIQVADLKAPAQLSIDRFSVSPRPVTRSSDSIAVTIGITACGGRPVQGALVFGVAVPYQQFKGAEGATDANGSATLTMQKLRFFPASPRQQLLAVFVRARQPGADLLGGVSNRRLVSFPVRVNG